MPTKDKKRGTWMGRIQKVEYPFRKKRGFRTKAEASKWEREELEKIKKIRPKSMNILFIAQMNICPGANVVVKITLTGKKIYH